MTAEASGRSRGDVVWLLFAALSLTTVLTGCWVARAHGAPIQGPMLNSAAWLVGAGLAVGTARLKAGAALGWLALTAAALSLTLVSPGLLGVHRWIGIGPLRLNGAELMLPVALAACAGPDRGSLSRLLFTPVVLVLLAAQPDLSQAAAVAAAGLVLLLTSNSSWALRALPALSCGIALAVTALRPDPLAPVPEVEGIVGLAAATSPALAALGVAALAGAVATPLVLARAATSPVRDAALALAAYLAVSALAPAAGAFPVPLMGMGVSPIIGAWLGIGWLMHLARQPDGPPARS